MRQRVYVANDCSIVYTPSEFAKLLDKIKLSEKDKEKLIEKVFSDDYNYRLFINPHSVWVASGYQTWGSGGYHAYWEILLGSKEKIEIVNKEEKNTQFVKIVRLQIRPIEKPFIVSCLESDNLSSRPTRFIAIWI